MYQEHIYMLFFLRQIYVLEIISDKLKGISAIFCVLYTNLNFFERIVEINAFVLRFSVIFQTVKYVEVLCKIWAKSVTYHTGFYLWNSWNLHTYKSKYDITQIMLIQSDTINPKDIFQFGPILLNV